MNNITIEKAGELLASQNNILFLCHQRADGDTLGCAVALKDVLCNMGKTAHIYCATPIQNRLRYLVNGEENLLPPKDFEPDFICSVDVAELNMLGEGEALYGDKIDLNLDHHHTNRGFGKYHYYEGAAACCEIVYEIIKKCFAFTPLSLDAIYTGVATDTGCFQYTNVTPATHIIAADLISQGCNFTHLNHILFESKTRSEIHCNSVALNNLSFYQEDKIAMIAFSYEDKMKYAITDDDISAYAALPREIEGVLCGISIREVVPGEFKVSFRSGVEFDVSTICVHFGGGGHHSASGCTIKAQDIEQAKIMVLDETISQFKKQGL